MNARVCGVVMLAALAAPGAAAAQSLADIARQEADRRRTLPPAQRIYTNNDLTPDFTRPAAATPAEAAKPAEADAAPPAEDPVKAEEASEAEKWGVTPLDQQEPAPKDDKNEDYWRSRATLIRGRVSNAAFQVDQLRARLAAFASGSQDPERAIVEQSLAKAIADQRSINDEWLRFERQARDRKIPDAWIR